jgi:hypothetical protein
MSKSKNGKMGGRNYDITKGTGNQREKHSHNDNDVLTHVPKKILKDHLVMQG